MKLLSTLLFLSVIISSCSSNKVKEPTAEEKRAMIYYGQGTRDLVDKDYTKALKNLLEANALKPHDTKIHTNLGMAYYFKKNHDLALKHLNRALEIDTKNSDARQNIATIYMEQGKLDLAEHQYQLVLKDLVYESQYRTYYNLGILELRRNNFAKSIEHFKASIGVNENYCPAFYQLGKIHYNQNNYKSALKMFREASMGTCFENPEPHYMQAMTMIKMKDYAKASMKLEEMTEKFALTKYEAIARKALIDVKKMKNKNYQESMEAKNYDGNILTPDF
jgi:tetratricopeptide (TPR) repeat protein